MLVIKLNGKEDVLVYVSPSFMTLPKEKQEEIFTSGGLIARIEPKRNKGKGGTTHLAFECGEFLKIERIKKSGQEV